MIEWGARTGPFQRFSIPMPDDDIRRNCIAVIPAAGKATRISPLPCSKEIYPLGLSAGHDGRQHPRTVCEYLLEKLARAGINRVLVVLREGKWDIPTYLGNGVQQGLNIGYLLARQPWGAPYTIDSAFEFVAGNHVVLGYPDILFDADDAFDKLIERQVQHGAEVVLGLFPGDRPDKSDMVATDPDGRVLRIEIKPAVSSLRWTWGIALWTPCFSRYLHEYLKSHAPREKKSRELFVGDVLQAAIRDGLLVDSVQVSSTPYLDIGTPEDLQRAIGRFISP